MPLRVMNTILGGLFSSRINMNLREANGYTYGAGSQFVVLAQRRSVLGEHAACAPMSPRRPCTKS